MPKKFIPQKFEYEESENELSEQDRESLKQFLTTKSLKKSSASSSSRDHMQKKPAQKILKNSEKKKKQNQPRKISNKENKQFNNKKNNNKEKIKNNPDHNLNKSIIKARKFGKQQSTGLLKLPFQRLLKDITQKEKQKRENFKEGLQDYRYSRDAFSLVLCNTEGYLIEIFQDSYLCTNHAKRVTLMNRDLYLARRIRGD